MTNFVSITKLPKKIPLWLWKHSKAIGTSSIILITLLLLVHIWQKSDRFFTQIRQIFTLSVESQADIDTLIVHRMQEVSELTTAVFVMESVVPTHQDLKLGDVVVARTKLLYIAHGEVEAGIDLSTLQPEDIKVGNNQIEIKLPSPQILDTKIDVNRSRVYDYDRGFLGLGPDVAFDLQNLAETQTLKKIRANACEQGILEQANEKGTLVVTQLLKTMGYARVMVKTSAPNPNGCIAEVRG